MKKQSKLSLILLALILVAANLSVIAKAWATNTYLTNLTVAETNMQASGTSEVGLSFKTSSSNTGTTLVMTFGGWSGGGGSLLASPTVTNGCAAFPGLAGANLPTSSSITAAGSSNTVTFSGLSAMSASTQYCVTLSSSNSATNPSAGQYGVAVTAGSDSATTAEIDVISSDQYVVNADVPPTFTMTSPSTPDNFSFNLSSTGLTTTGGTSVTVTTNAKNGWFLWAQDNNGGLNSTIAGYTIPSVTTGSNQNFSSGSYGPGHEAYGLGVTSITTSGTATTNYADAGGTTGGGLSNSALNEIADGTMATNGSTVNLKELANIAGTTQAGPDYTDTITLVGAGSF